ncbi:hypothetical protein Q2T40_04490 [Winogradskyella maritima]|nr:hypothetical protein [Winogradskyella maritima]
MPKVALKLLKKKLGFRTVLDIIPLDATLIKGSHGRVPEDKADYPILISDNPSATFANEVDATDVFGIVENHVTEKV